ncbi:symmetrical bis(5'-nucleosyl)-tetraphosphatase [Noviherbaspirillum saxi]|uniref:Bis(5'-nucleosyl)-tetraphosphatase, symmetrical n=1 Tax=Noviherbaspirillum saxi TaxID=2320863 RepID=A0A3A3FP53_9BURK|nr:symmetrical bis(5'-nucleosyl)-tetraphosphatase [Noviherbaspirillum saxi]RJF97796.1 symmetrical bis(5'-nucleosyl)-tetraphosphatase [Noviherbaspirillum saxi]
MPTYVIGDLQGCRTKLTELLERIHAHCADPRLIFVGDLVNRGPNSLETLREVRELGDTTNVVLGNHDLHLLAVANGIRPQHRTDTLDEILDAPDRDELLDWLRHRPLAILENDHLMVHAGVLPQWTAQQTIALSQEVEQMLQGPDWLDFLRQMYGNQPARWEDRLEGMDRLRCIVNALTRLRFCSADGTMDLATSKGVEIELPGYMRWFDVPGRNTEDTTVVFGHWSTLGLIMRPDIISLDTGCLWGGKLSAVCLDDRSVIQVDCPQYQKPGSI